MSLHCGFLFPKNEFNLTSVNTIGYISDSVFYQVNLGTMESKVESHPEGRSYQAFTSNAKRQLIVLVEYGKNPTFYFNFSGEKNKSFKTRDICALEVTRVSLSLNGRYLAIQCGIPTPEILFYDIEERRVLKGHKNSVILEDEFKSVRKVEFNPSNPKQLAVQYHNKIDLYEIKESFELSKNGESLEESISVKKIDTVTDNEIEMFIWDEINNLYISNKKEIYIYSTDTKSKVLSCDIEVDYNDEADTVVANILLTRKHIIVFYKIGRIEWMNKYNPEAMEEEDVSLRPFYLDRYYETGKEIAYSLFDLHFMKIFLTFSEGCFGILNKQAESNEAEEDEEDNAKKHNNTNTEKKIDIEMIYSPYYHSSPILLIHEFPQTAVCMTLSSAGRVIHWSVKQKKQLETHAIHNNITCASVNKTGNVLVTGHNNGVIRFYSIAKPDDIFLFKEFRLTKSGSIDQIIFSTNGEELAVLSKTENKVFYILTNLSSEFEVLGFAEIPYPVKSISWMGNAKSVLNAKFEHLLVSIGFGVLMVNSPVNTPSKKRGKELDLKPDIYALRTDLNQNLVACLPSGELITTGKDKFIKKYKQPEDLVQKIDWKSKVPPNPPIEEIDGHDFEIKIFKHSEGYFLTGGSEGKIHLRDYNNLNSISEIKAYGWKNEFLNYVYGSWSKGIVYTAGRDGSFYIWKIGNTELKADDKLELPVPNFKKIHSSNEIKYYEVVIEDDYREKMKETIEQKKKQQISKISKIREELKHLLEENEKQEELEKLNRDEFAIDVYTREKVAKEGEEICKKIMEESKKRILHNEVYAKKLKEITWDRMDVHLSAINGLKNNFIVYNYQIRKISALEKRKIKLILELRKAQKRQEKKRTSKIIDFEDYKNKNVINGGFLAPLVMTPLESKKDDMNKKDDKKKGKKEDEVNGQQNNQAQEQTDELPTEEEFTLLYSAFELFNPNAKRNQIIMMKNIINLIKKSFNKEFNKLLKFRQNQNEMINDKNKRIVEICEELKRESEIIISRDNILESNERILEVKSSEIPFQRYLSREEREKLEKERLKEEERLRKLAEDDSAQRALQKMMGGTLEEKKVSALEITVEKEKWMEKPIEEMSEEEKIKLKEYETKKQKAEEEKERIVKKLEAELRKLRQEIDEIMEKYDEKLFDLLKKRLEYDYRIQEQELYCSRLALTMVDQEEERRRHQEIEEHIKVSKERLEHLANQQEKLASHTQEIESQKEQKRQNLEKEKLGEFDSKIKTIEKSVFEDFHTNVKKKREFEDKLLEHYPVFKNQIISLDPFKEQESKYLLETVQKHYKYFAHEVKALQQTFDIPENTIEKLLENRFNLRREEHELEEKLRILTLSIQNLEESLEDSNKDVEQNEKELQEIESFLIQCKSDLDIEIRIKQGQLEINSEKPVPDLEGALLIAKSEIDEKNSKIKTEANEKIAVMKEIKTCKIKVTEETLNLEKKQEQIDKLSTMIKEIQMLKVKKEMQVALSKKDAKMNENELKSLKEQIEKVRKEGEKRIAIYEDKIKKILKEIDTIKKENRQLETQKWNLDTTVKQKEKIKDMMVGDGESGQESVEKFNQISINRQLFDKAKQQTEEIELLREELSKLKAKTFANFSNVQR